MRYHIVNMHLLLEVEKTFSKDKLSFQPRIQFVLLFIFMPEYINFLQIWVKTFFNH